MSEKTSLTPRDMALGDADLSPEEIRVRLLHSKILEKMERGGMMSDEELAEEVRRGSSHVVEGFIAALPWTSHATEHNKALVAGNLRTFWQWLHTNSRGRIERSEKRTPFTPENAAELDRIERSAITRRSVVEEIIRDLDEQGRASVTIAWGKQDGEPTIRKWLEDWLRNGSDRRNTES